MAKIGIFPELMRLTLSFKKPYIFEVEEITPHLIEKGFSIPSENEVVLRIGRDGRQSQAHRWIREDVEVFYEPTRVFFSIDGKNIEKVIAGYSDICATAQQILEDSFNDNLLWSELYMVVRVRGSKKPLETIGSKFSCVSVNNFNDIFGFQMNPARISLYYANDDSLDKPLTEIVDWIDIGIEPFVQNPSYYFLRIVCRLKDSNRIQEINQELSKKIEEMIELLED